MCSRWRFAMRCHCFVRFCFNATASTEIYTLSLHDALPIFRRVVMHEPLSNVRPVIFLQFANGTPRTEVDRKSTRLNSSHPSISYAVFCLKKKKHYSEPQLPHNIQPRIAHLQYLSNVGGLHR